MSGQDMRAGRFGHPFRPESGQVRHPIAEIADMAGDRIVAEAARSTLPAPVGRGDVPAPVCPVVQRFQILLVIVAAAGEEQDRAARILRLPVDPADGVAIGCVPAALARCGGNGAPIEGRAGSVGGSGFVLANTGLLRVVTFW